METARILGVITTDPCKWDGLVVLCAANSYDSIKVADQHMAEQLSRMMPVLYVDPPLSRLTPAKNPELAQAITGPRLRVLAAGLARLTPVVQPFPSRPGIASLTTALAARHVRRAVSTLGGQAQALISAWPLYPVLPLKRWPGYAGDMNDYLGYMLDNSQFVVFGGNIHPLDGSPPRTITYSSIKALQAGEAPPPKRMMTSTALRPVLTDQQRDYASILAVIEKLGRPVGTADLGRYRRRWLEFPPRDTSSRQRNRLEDVLARMVHDGVLRATRTVKGAVVYELGPYATAYRQGASA